MHSYDGMLANCQRIYTEYLNHNSIHQASQQLIAEVEQIIASLQVEINNQSASGVNTVLLEKMQQDLLHIHKDLSAENS